MPYESDARFVSRTVGHAVLASLALVLLLLMWFMSRVADGTLEETYLLVALIFLVCVFLVCFAMHLVIQIRLEESDRQKIEFLFGHTIKEGNHYDEQERAESNAYKN